MSEQRQGDWGGVGYIPDHVPAHLVQPVDFTGPEMSQCPFAAKARLHGTKRIFWNPHNPQFGGSWVPTEAEDYRFILNNPQLFSNKGETGFSAMLGESWDMVPLELDPPEHTKFRKLLSPLLSPSRVAAMTPGMTERAVSLIEAVRENGECEFISAFGRPFPVGIFMQLMGLPLEDMPTFLKWEFELLHAPEVERKLAAAAEIRDFLKDLAAKRRTAPRDDLTSFVVTAKVDGRLFTDDEVLGTLYLLFVGGLDTVASSLGFYFRYLAEHPELQNRLRADPKLISRSIDEFLRRFSVVALHRQCRQDVEVAGVKMKKGDWVTIDCALASSRPQRIRKSAGRRY